jgi:tetratricopeptide (TPR) repeat protein
MPRPVSYDRDLEDIFAVQDEITHNIVAELDVHLLAGEQARLWSSGTENLQAWEYFRRARDLFSSYRVENHPEVKQLIQKAIDLDPEYASAWSLMAGLHFHIEEDGRYSGEERKQAMQLISNYAQQALKCDPSCATAYSTLALYHLTLKEYDEAIGNAQKSIDMAPNNASNIAVFAVILNKCGQPERAIEHIRRALRLCPVYPLWFLSVLGQVLRGLGRTEEAIGAYAEMTEHYSDSLEGQVGLAEILSRAGRTEAAKAAAAEVLRINPDFSISEYVGNLSYRDANEITRFEEGLRQAGLPE